MDTITNTHQYKRANIKLNKSAFDKEKILKIQFISNKENTGNMKYNEKRLQSEMEGLHLSDQPQSGTNNPSMEAVAGKPNRGCGWRRGHRLGAQGTDSEAVNVCQMRRRKMRMMREMMKAAHSEDNFGWNNHGMNVPPSNMTMPTAHNQGPMQHWRRMMMMQTMLPCRTPYTGPQAFGAGLGSGPVYSGMGPMMGMGHMYGVGPQSHMNIWQNSLQGFPGKWSKQQCKRKNKQESNEEGNDKEDNNTPSSTKYQAGCSDDKNENTEPGKPAGKNGKCRKQMRQAASMNSYIHPGFVPPFMMDAMPEGGQKQIMRKWWKQMQKSEKQDAESTEKSASSDENVNEEYPRTEASKDSKTEDEVKTERQQRRQMRRRAMSFFATGMMAPDAPSMGPSFMGPPPEFVRAFIRKQMHKNKKMKEYGEGNKEEEGSADEVVADCCDSTPDNTPLGEKSEKSIGQDKSEKDPKKKSEQRKCRQREMKQAMAMNAYMFPGFTGGMYVPPNGYMVGGGMYGPPPPYVQRWMQQQLLRQQKKNNKQTKMSEHNVQKDMSGGDDEHFEHIEVDN